jgi:hypothetical protein
MHTCFAVARSTDSWMLLDARKQSVQTMFDAREQSVHVAESNDDVTCVNSALPEVTLAPALPLALW